MWLDRPIDGSHEEAERLWHQGVWEASFPDSSSWPFHPTRGGLLEWGHDEQGSSYFFLVLEPDPDDWRVVGGEAGEWFETAGTFTDFLLRCFDRVDRPPFLDSGWPGRDARYHEWPERSTDTEHTDARTRRRTLPPGVTGIELPENLGVSGGHNVAIAHLRAAADVDVIVDPDDGFPADSETPSITA